MIWVLDFETINEAVSISETSVSFYETIRRNNPKTVIFIDELVISGDTHTHTRT
jgi:hypothetical protein